VRRFTNSNLWIKTTHWEYWPWYLVYIPVYAYWLWLGARAGTIFFFSAANPFMRYGGILGGSKKEILDHIPHEYQPITCLLTKEATATEVLSVMQSNGLRFPIIMKPDIGERGHKVELIKNESHIETYLGSVTTPVMVQEFINLPVEVGVFYYRFPDKKQGEISSVVIKELLTVTGDGEHSLAELIGAKARAKLQLNRLAGILKDKINAIPEAGAEVLLEPIGNHNRGTAFLNGSHLINDQLRVVFDELSWKIKGFHYGRFDLRCASIAALNRGEFKIMELNGAASEPAHIYSPGFSIIEGYRSLFHHWKVLFNISRANHRNGVKYMSFKTGMEALAKSRLT
jgi:hypothetical protein